MSKNIRIRTEPNAGDKELKIQLNQDFDFLEILSLKISQEDVYRNFYSDYGVVVGRVIMNSGVGVPNARVSIFIPLTDEDAQDVEISTIYPYTDLQVTNDDGVRYNTLPNDSQGECHAPIGTFPTKRELIDNEVLFEVYEKYYKYTTTTNSAGDFMLFGVPVGSYILNVDVDLSDIGIFSQRPYDFIEQGNPAKLFESPTKFKSGTNLNNLTQVRGSQVGVNVIPFWGENLDNEVGITRVDIDMNYNVTPQAIFMGSIFGDNDKHSVNKNCRARRKLGRVCETNEGEGTIEMIRKTPFGEIEKFELEGGQLINEDGAWAFQVPMNLDYVVTNEFGDLVPSEDINKGIPTRAKMRFKISMNETGGDGRLRTKAKYLVPNNPKSYNLIDYSFDDSTSDDNLRDLYWNKIYTVKNHISRFQNKTDVESRAFIGLKDVDDCVGLKNPPPFNKIDTDLNPLFSILCFLMTIIIFGINLINSVISFSFKIIGISIRPFCWIGCVRVNCPITDNTYYPGCGGDGTRNCGSNGNNSKSENIKCLRLTLADALNVFEFDFYNDWLNGSLYSFLLKYKRVNKNNAKFCGEDLDNGDANNELSNKTYVINTNIEGGGFIKSEGVEVSEGVVVNYDDELFYKPISNSGIRLYPTDLYSLGAIFDCDWQGKVKTQNGLVSTSYKLPPLVPENDEFGNIMNTGLVPLLFDLDCVNARTNSTQLSNIRNICEIGVGLDDDDDLTDNITGNLDRKIDSKDIEDELIRRQLILLNDSNYVNSNLNDIGAKFEDLAYKSYRRKSGKESGNLNRVTTYENSFYFYFGTKPNRTALDLMKNKFFTTCSRLPKTIINITGIVSDVTTISGSDGSINITVSGGSPIINDDNSSTYIYRWYNELNEIIGDTEDIENLSAGKYFVLVKDANDLEVKKTFIVRGINELGYTMNIKNTKDLSSESGEINIESITGGIGPYDVKITNLNNSLVKIYEDVPYAISHLGLGVGSFEIEISDSNDPIDTISTTVNITTPQPLIVTDETKQVNCENYRDGEIILTIEGGTPTYEVEVEQIITNDDINEVFSVTSEGGVIRLNELESGDYRYRVSDSYSQTSNWVTVTIKEQNELRLTRYHFVNKLRVNNLIIGQTYELYNNNEVKLTFVASSIDLDLVSEDFPINNEKYTLISEFGCTSNSIN